MIYFHHKVSSGSFYETFGQPSHSGNQRIKQEPGHGYGWWGGFWSIEFIYQARHQAICSLG